MTTDLSIVVSVYNEESVLNTFYSELVEALDFMNDSVKIIFVNDGSTDKTLDLLKEIAQKDDRVSVINFSRNFGHEYAMMAGIDHSNASAIICMDADCQHPPQLIPEMWNEFRNGSEIVTMIRSSREDGGMLKKFTTRFFYRLINLVSEVKIDPNASDYYLISARVAQIIKTDYKEKTRFLRGFIQMVGFEKSSISYDAPKRFAGKSKYSMLSLFSFSLNAVASMTKAPLKIGIYLGFLNAILCILVGGYSLVMFFLDKPFSGYTTIVLLMTFMFSMLFFVIGILGYYIGYIFDQTKNRPHYIVKDIIEAPQTK